MDGFAVDNKSLPLPVLVPSISSFETQLDPASAIQLQFALREPISLVSAYDLRKVGSDFQGLCDNFRKSGILLLDSGGYEYSRIKQYGQTDWSFSDYKQICQLGIYDYVFSYDYFWGDKENETPEDFELRLIDEIFNGHTFIPRERIIPVIHLYKRTGDHARLSKDQILSLVTRIAYETKSPFIAIPERELGDGIVERCEITKSICDALSKGTPSVGLHVLGCGNLLSFAFLSVAGAKMFDGLEWYRTFVADNFHLHHFQHEPAFPGPEASLYNPAAGLILGADLPYRVKVATMNLVSLQSFSSELAPRLSRKTVHELVASHYGSKAATALRGIEA